MPKLQKESHNLFLCVFIFQMFAESIDHRWHEAPQDRALLRSCTLVFHLKCSKTVQTDVTRLRTGRQATPSLAPVLTVVTVFVPMSTLWAERLSGFAFLHAHSDTSIDTDKVVQEFCARKPRRLAFEFWTPVHKPSFGLTFYNATLKQLRLCVIHIE